MSMSSHLSVSTRPTGPVSASLWGWQFDLEWQHYCIEQKVRNQRRFWTFSELSGPRARRHIKRLGWVFGDLLGEWQNRVEQHLPCSSQSCVAGEAPSSASSAQLHWTLREGDDAVSCGLVPHQAWAGSWLLGRNTLWETAGPLLQHRTPCRGSTARKEARTGLGSQKHLRSAGSRGKGLGQWSAEGAKRAHLSEQCWWTGAGHRAGGPEPSGRIW